MKIYISLIFLLSIFTLSGCSLAPKEPSLKEVYTTSEKEYLALPTLIYKKNILIYLDVDSNDPRFQKLLREKILSEKFSNTFNLNMCSIVDMHMTEHPDTQRVLNRTP
jgi:hypothetical protein